MKKSLLVASALLLLSACGNAATDDQTLETHTFNTVMGTKNLVDPIHGKETRFAYGAVLGVAPTSANGVAYAHTFEDGTSVVSINLNILPPKAGKHLIGWVLSADKSSAVIVGELNNPMSDARHAVIVETKASAEKLVTVLVTLENSATPKVPGTPQAQGELKVYQR
jgi:hypothetical protein